MKDYIKQRVYELAEYLLTTGATVRAAASRFNVSKSTVHKDVTERLAELDPALAFDVQKILDVNLSERHLRGGEATKRKFADR